MTPTTDLAEKLEAEASNSEIHGTLDAAYLCRQAADTLRKQAEELERLTAIARGVRDMQLIDAEDVGDRVVFRFAMPGEQFFNPPKFIVEARALDGLSVHRAIFDAAAGPDCLRKGPVETTAVSNEQSKSAPIKPSEKEG